MYKKLLVLGFILLFSVICFVPFTYAEIPHLINYQGRLTDAAGKPLDNVTKDVAFRIYNVENGGTPIWQGTYSVLVQKGYFNVLLGDKSDSGYNFENLAFDKPYWLEIKVGSDSPMQPRQRITSSGYAINADKLGAKQAGDYVLQTEITTTPTANKVVKLDNNAKLPTTALKTYDSGWFAVSQGSAVTKSHNLGTTKVLYNISFAQNADGSGWFSSGPQLYSFNQFGNGITSLTSSQITVCLSTGGTSAISYQNTDGTEGQASSGFCRITMLALE